MGAIAEAIVAYAKPLMDGTDGDVDQMNRALTIATACWNLAIMPEDQRDETIDQLQPTLGLSDADFAQFRQQILLPMIRRHHEMFPAMHGRSPQTSGADALMSSTKHQRKASRNAPCPCGSGRKYKHCCGARK